jgi:hypothetical protein
MGRPRERTFINKRAGQKNQNGNILRKRKEIGEFLFFGPYKTETSPEEKDY